MPTNRSAPVGPVIPVLTCPDVRAQVDWLRDVLGFAERVRIGDDHRAQLTFGTGSLIVADVGGARVAPREGAVTASVMMRVDDATAVLERAREHDATILMEPTDFEYGERQCAFVDPAGHQWTLTQTLRDVAPEAWGGVTVGARATADAAGDWERRVADAWAAFDEVDESAFVARIDELAAERPDGDAAALYELGSAQDSTGHSDRAVPLYRRALAAGLDDARRRQVTVQLASSLRNVGAASEGLALVDAELARGPSDLDDAFQAFRALLLVDLGREREAVAGALEALAPHLPRYQRSVAAYARDLR